MLLLLCLFIVSHMLVRRVVDSIATPEPARIPLR
jgi:hypothetical protein